jgi:hypothetical protein
MARCFAYVGSYTRLPPIRLVSPVSAAGRSAHDEPLDGLALGRGERRDELLSRGG